MGDNQKTDLIGNKGFRIFVILTIVAFIFSFTACGKKEKNIDKGDADKVKVLEKVAGDKDKPGKAADYKDKATKAEPALNLNMGDVGNNLPLPDNYPKEILPLAGDAKIINVVQNTQNNGLGIIYISDDDLDSLLELNESALSDAKDLKVLETDDGYMLMASLEGVHYTIMIGEGLFDQNSEYKGKQSVYIELTRAEGLSDNGEGAEIPADGGKPWPASDMAEVPELPGYIGNVHIGDDAIRLEITVEGLDVVKGYIGELKNAGFSFDSEPDTSNEKIEFIAFKDSTMLNFAYKAAEKLVFIEYIKS
ncbi:MAG TPA: hypothetical protein PK733_19820 [Clostridiales bacterium]|nr:hypothetical protein [Clostridiales bacterium]